ncbi:Uncharacterised protein [Serratia quinivorans]|nr:Uncharacterised protein [Serratia quinivorans]
MKSLQFNGHLTNDSELGHTKTLTKNLITREYIICDGDR